MGAAEAAAVAVAGGVLGALVAAREGLVVVLAVVAVLALAGGGQRHEHGAGERTCAFQHGLGLP